MTARDNKCVDETLYWFLLRIHNRFGGMRDLPIFVVILGIRAENRSGMREFYTSGSGISYFYGDGMRKS